MPTEVMSLYAIRVLVLVSQWRHEMHGRQEQRWQRTFPSMDGFLTLLATRPEGHLTGSIPLAQNCMG